MWNRQADAVAGAIAKPRLLHSNDTMFTGIVQHLGRVAHFEPNQFGAALKIEASGWNHTPALGESIAVNGCCLTVSGDPSSTIGFDVIRQTLDVTTLGCLRVGDQVNLEHALTPNSLMGGHVVQGHVDDVGTVTRVVSTDQEHRLRIEPSRSHSMACIIAKGSIAVNGVSLTIAAVEEAWFEVALIPVTLRTTNLGMLQVGSRVNLETDYLAKLVVNWLERTRSA